MVLSIESESREENVCVNYQISEPIEPIEPFEPFEPFEPIDPLNFLN